MQEALSVASRVFQVIPAPLQIVRWLMQVTRATMSMVPRVLQVAPAALRVTSWCVSYYPGIVPCHSCGVAGGTGTGAGHPGSVPYPSRAVADRSRAVTRALGGESDDLGEHTDDLGEFTADSIVPTARTGVSAADTWFATDDVVMRPSPAGWPPHRRVALSRRSAFLSREAGKRAARVEQSPRHPRVQPAGVAGLPSAVPSPYRD